jgi:malonyl-CoA O-methyltransferase
MGSARGLFVTGTDTGVGKTVVSAALMIRLRSAAPLRYWKPIQTGIEQDDDTATVAWLAGCSAAELLSSGVRLRYPVSPHLAARLSGTVIDLAPLEDTFNEASRSARVVVEGAGGALVPVNDIQFMIDLMARLDLPTVIASRSTLGTINHTLLTIEALRHRSVTIAGAVLVGPPNADNRHAIEQYGGVRVLGEMPPFDALTPVVLSAWAAAELDREHVLTELLQ